MKSSRGNARSYTCKIEQIIAEFFNKALQIIIESRCSEISSPFSSSSSCSSSFKARDNWFNLALKECPQALEHIDSFRQGNTVSMVTDIVLCDSLKFSCIGNCRKNHSSKGQFCNFVGFEREEFGREFRTENVIERWVVQFEKQKSKECNGNLHALYKKLIVLMRSLYTTVRLLPAYKICRNLVSLKQTHSYRVSYRVSSFGEPFTRKEEANMNQFSFTPVDTSWGRLCVSVSYKSWVCNVNAETSVMISPWFIPDYVGNQLVQPLKGFSSFPVSHGPQPPMYLVSPPVKFKDTSKSIDVNELWSSSVYFPIPFPSSSMCVARMDASKALLHHESAPGSTSADASASLLRKMSFCRRSRRFQIGDDFENITFSCPFAGDDDNMVDSVSRSESDNEAGGSAPLPVSRSEDAAIGALIMMLKTAPPLARLKLECQQSEKSTASKRVSSKTLSDGVEELQAFVSIKEMLLSHHSERSRFTIVNTLL